MTTRIAWRDIVPFLLLGLLLLGLIYLWIGHAPGVVDTESADEGYRAFAEQPASSRAGLLVVLAGAACVAVYLCRFVVDRVLPEPETAEPPPWGLFHVLLVVLGWLSLSVLLGQIYLSLVDRLALPDPLDTENPNPYPMLFVTGIANLVVLVLAISFVRRLGGLREMGLTIGSPVRQVAGGWLLLVGFVPIFIFTVTLTLVPYVARGVGPRMQPIVRSAVEQVGQPNFVWIVLFAVVLAPVFEETIYRGLLYPALRRHLPVSWAAATSGALFAVVHGQPMPLLPLFALGALLAVAFERTRSLLVSIAMHATFNGIQLIFMVMGFGSR